MREGDVVKFVDPRWNSDKIFIKGIVKGFYHPAPLADSERARVVTNSGHEWLLKVNELEILIEEK